MASLTLSIPEELREKMREFPEINWSEVARQAIAEKTRILEKANRLLAESGLEEKESLTLGREIKKAVWQKHRR